MDKNVSNVQMISIMIKMKKSALAVAMVETIIRKKMNANVQLINLFTHKNSAFHAFCQNTLILEIYSAKIAHKRKYMIS